MLPINYTAIAVATFAAFVFSGIYYTILNKRITNLRKSYLGESAVADAKMSPTTVIIELARTFVLGLAMAYAVINAQNITQALVVVVWLWIAFPVVLLVGSVIHERVPVGLAMIHAFDWLVKLIIFAVVLTLWP